MRISASASSRVNPLSSSSSKKLYQGLPSLVQMRRFDQVLEVADKMVAAPGFLTGKDNLRRNIDFLRSRSLR